MRILFIVHRAPYPPNKGEKLRALWELRELSRQHTVDLFCFYDDPDDKKHAQVLSQYCRHHYMEKTSYWASGLRAISASLLGQPFSVAFFRSRRMRKRIEAALHSERYDRIVVFSSSMAQYARYVKDIPRILDMVDVDSDKWSQYANHSSWLWSWLWRREAKCLGLYESALVREFTRTVMCTHAEAQLLRSKAPVGHIEVLENFIDVDAYARSNELPDLIRHWQPYVIFSGSMDYWPNVDAVQYLYREVFPLIRRQMPQVRLVIAGRNPTHSILALKKDPCVEVTGGVPDMRPYLWGASAAVVPMRMARGIQNKILEALASGTPVVSSTLAASALAPALRSLVTLADSPNEISAAVIKLLHHGSDNSPEALHEALKAYMNSLELPSQWQSLISDPSGGLVKKEKSDQYREPTLQLAAVESVATVTTPVS
jgi:polysaccharide biosynthesis protein PslH